MKRILLLGLASAMLPALAWEFGGDVRIVVPDPEPTGCAQALAVAGERLANGFADALGAKVAVHEASKAPKGGRTIYLGGVFAASAGLMPADMRTYSNVIAEKGGDIYLFGADRSGRDPSRGRQDAKRLVLPSINAMARFMERFLDTRFVMPGEIGTATPRRTAPVTVPDGLFDRGEISIDFGPERFYECVYDKANLIIGEGRYHTYGGHTYPAACPISLGKAHPEYFGVENGVRSFSTHFASLCISNPAVEDLIVREMLARYDEGAEVCQLGQQDGLHFCECERCASYGGTGPKDYGEKFWIFHRRIAERIERLRPGKLVHIMCYGWTAHPPKTFRKFPSNVLIEQCRCTQADFDQWNGYEIPHGFTVDLYTWGDYVTPGFTQRHTPENLHELAARLIRNRVRGVYRCGYGEEFGMEGPGYWVFNRTLMDPSLDVAAAVEDYCRHCYGPAADLMKRFHALLDARVKATDRLCGLGDGLACPARPDDRLALHAYVYTPETVRKMEPLLARAERLPTLNAKERKRLELVRLEFDYQRNLGEIATLYKAYKLHPTKEAFAPLAAALKERKALLDRCFDGKGRVIGISGWPESKGFVFGHSPRKMVLLNGRSGATLGAPLTWDVDSLLAKGILPGASLKTMKAKKASADPGTGDFESGEWARHDWQTLGGVQLGEVRVRTRFKLAYDDTCLYFAGETELPDDEKVIGVTRDAKAYNVECFDLFVDPSGTTDSFFHLVWNPCENSVYDAEYGFITDIVDPLCGEEDVRWNPNAKIFNERKDGKWRTVMKIAFADLRVSAPVAGDRYRFNVGRAVNPDELRGAWHERELALWSPNMENPQFNSADAMGIVEFQ